jgi:pimeloyl-ACP methyl ester carboxylesterase
MFPRVRQILKTTAVVLVVILLAGATYQGVATALERRKYPHPGSLIDVGEHQLHIYCTGENAEAATVILEAPEGGMSAEWAWVQSTLSEKGRVCSYDRAGLGWSEAGDRPYDPGRVPEELHQLLRNADIPPPYVIAGQSLGAAFARLFASRYPGEIAALVVIDFPRADAPGDARLVAAFPWLARAGLLRASGVWADRAEGLPAQDAGVLRSFLDRPDHLTRASREFARWEQAITLATDAPLPNELEVHDVKLRPEALNNPHHAKRLAAAIPQIVIHKSEPSSTRKHRNPRSDPANPDHRDD